MAVTGYNHWGKLAQALKPACQSVVKQVAFEIAADARGLVPKDTGFLNDSIYVGTWEDSTYDTSSIPPPGDSYLLPEEPVPDDMSAIVGVAANYGEYVEFGTRFMAAQPYFYPAMEWGRRSLEAELNVLWAKVAGQLGGSTILAGSVT